ncbi:MAG: (R)-specific enoyl-CoA hydratase RipB/Ich [Candidatus Velthaea sp.]
MSIKPGWEGRCYEDFEVGDIYEHRLGRTITENDNTWFTLLTMNTNPVHFDRHFSESTPFGKPLVNSCLTLSIVTGMSVSDISENAIANLAWTDVTMPKPVFEGDTLYARTEVLGTRESRSRPNAGIVDVRTEGFNQHGEIVMTFKRTMLVYRRGHRPTASRPLVKATA